MNTPEKIYGWMDSQLSLARFSGGCTFNGKSYVIDFDDPGKPLVRDDVFKREKKKKNSESKGKKNSLDEFLQQSFTI
jgi:hypothetical protein